MIVNPDGTMRRITNWDTLTKQEKESTWRIVSARNKKRLDALKKKMEIEAADNEIDAADETK